MTPISDEALEHFDIFTNIIKNRISIGRSTYGDSSFTKSDNEILNEIQEELADVVGWSFVQWYKIERMKRKL